MSEPSVEKIEARLAEMELRLINIQSMVANLSGNEHRGRTAYTVEEAASLLGKRPYTVRQWCLEGRINATKRAERRGGAEVWSISADEIVRYKNEGLLPRERARCAG